MIWTAFLLGLGGSLHCVGMCGPIVMALPLTATERRSVIAQSLLYHLGRISTYTLIGLFFGLMSWGIALTSYQNIFSILLGITLLISAFFTLSIKHQFFQHPIYQTVLQKIQSRLSKALSINSNASAFRIGLLNGFLPCGMVYIALAGAVTSGGILTGALYMAAFGVGTIPLLLGLMITGQRPRRWYSRFNQIIPYGLVIFGIFLIYRGLILDIPSGLRFWESTNFQIMCH